MIGQERQVGGESDEAERQQSAQTRPRPQPEEGERRNDRDDDRAIEGVVGEEPQIGARYRMDSPLGGAQPIPVDDPGPVKVVVQLPEDHPRERAGAGYDESDASGPPTPPVDS